MKEKEKKNHLIFVVIFSLCLFFSAFLSFLLVKDIYQSHKFDEQIKKFEAENYKIRRRNEIRNKEIKQFKFRNYGEKFAKEKLGKKMPGERTFIISLNEEDKKEKTTTVTQKRENPLEAVKDLSNTEKWWFYFFGPRVNRHFL